MYKIVRIPHEHTTMNTLAVPPPLHATQDERDSKPFHGVHVSQRQNKTFKVYN